MKSFILASMCICLICGFSGCGKGSVNPGVAEGMQYITDMDYSAALSSFETARTNGEEERLITRGMGIACMGLTDYEGAIENFLACLALSDGMVEDMDYDVNYYLAAAYQKAGRYSEAEAVYDAILALKSDETDAYFLRGNARLSQGQYEAAKEDFDKVVELEPANYSRLIQVYEVLSAEGYKEPGLLYLEAALSERSDRMSAFDKGCINYYLGNYEQAQVFLEEAKEDGGADAYLYLGMAYEATGDYNYAITNVYTSYLNRNEGNAEIYNQLGLCYMKQEDYASALSAFQSAMQIPENGMMQTLQFNEIIAYEYVGEYTQAAVLLENYLKIYPDDEAAKREYGFLSTR
ncbi:MAG: tetratricopeptide repeat protein [Lachnospiraceae bacterium]|nr:tetratricopeptide repeat protein [Lachnospiraceae bacterium]